MRFNYQIFLLILFAIPTLIFPSCMLVNESTKTIMINLYTKEYAFSYETLVIEKTSDGLRYCLQANELGQGITQKWVYLKIDFESLIEELSEYKETINSNKSILFINFIGKGLSVVTGNDPSELREKLCDKPVSKTFFKQFFTYKGTLYSELIISD